jgi:hypothetical protein
MKIQVECHGTTITIEKKYDDVCISDWFDFFRTCMIGISFIPSQIDEFIKEEAESIIERENDRDCK